MSKIIIRDNLKDLYSDIYTPEALAALQFMSVFNADVKTSMKERILRRTLRIKNKTPLDFLNPDSLIPGTEMKVRDARDGRFEGSEIPEDLQRQWIQGTGPAAKPNAPVESSLRNVSYALLSGADGWMFDGEDALGQITHHVAGQSAKPEAGHPERPAFSLPWQNRFPGR